MKKNERGKPDATLTLTTMRCNLCLYDSEKDCRLLDFCTSQIILSNHFHHIKQQFEVYHCNLEKHHVSFIGFQFRLRVLSGDVNISSKLLFIHIRKTIIKTLRVSEKVYFPIFMF